MKKLCYLGLEQITEFFVFQKLQDEIVFQYLMRDCPLTIGMQKSSICYWKKTYYEKNKKLIDLNLINLLGSCRKEKKLNQKLAMFNGCVNY